MFRHSCAYFLIEKPPKGLGFDRGNFYLYFGHSNENMLREIYGKFNKKQKTETLFANFGEIASFHKQNDEEKQKEEIIKKLTERVMNGNEKESYKARKDWIFARIEFIIKNTDRDTYYFSPNDKSIIDEYIKTYPFGYIEFKIEKNK